MTEQLVSTNPPPTRSSRRSTSHTADDVAAIVARARNAAPWWRDQGYDGRREALLTLEALPREAQ